jgi:hypothetical protein
LLAAESGTTGSTAVNGQLGRLSEIKVTGVTLQ